MYICFIPTFENGSKPSSAARGKLLRTHRPEMLWLMLLDSNFTFPYWGLEKQRRVQQEIHTSDQGRHICPAVRFHANKLEENIKPRPDLVLALGVQRGLKGSYTDIYAWHKTTTETPAFLSLFLPSLLIEICRVNMKEWDLVKIVLSLCCFS